MEATMPKFFLNAVVLFSATTAHAGLDVTAAAADVRTPEAIQPIEPARSVPTPALSQQNAKP